MKMDSRQEDTVSIATQTSEDFSCSEVFALLEQQKAELEDLHRMLKGKDFVPENIHDDIKMKALTSFTKTDFFGFFRFLVIETDLEMGTKMRPIDRFFLFFVKLKTGISNEFLSILFDIPDSTVLSDFILVMDILYSKLQLLGIFPPKSQVIEYMPPPFRLGNKDVRVIIDFVEFTIEKPNSSVEQQMTFSHNKNANTVKGMIGVTPNGAISFISPLYCGSISDKQLFIKSKLMDRLEPNDVVMADKNVLIANELESIGCRLQCPLFLTDNIQCDLSDMVDNCNLSIMQVLIERVEKRIKQYKFFEGVIPYDSLPFINSIFFIACMVCNFHRKPLI